MPLFEYICQPCGHRFSWLVGVVAGSSQPTCPRCNASQADKRPVSRFVQVRTDAQALDDLAAGPSTFDGDPADPRQMHRWAQEMGALAGQTGGGLGDDFDEYIDAAASSQSSTSPDHDSL